MTSQQQPQLFAFEQISSENFAYIPLSVRFHLDRTGLRISLEDWQQLPLDKRIALSSYRVDDSLHGGDATDDFTAQLTDWMQTYVGHLPESRPPPASLPGDALEYVADGVLAQCEWAALAPVSLDDWRHLRRFQRYALAKLSRKPKANHDFIPAMKEFGLAQARHG